MVLLIVVVYPEPLVASQILYRKTLINTYVQKTNHDYE
jgi:hypothetical protein